MYIYCKILSINFDVISAHNLIVITMIVNINESNIFMIVLEIDITISNIKMNIHVM